MRRVLRLLRSAENYQPLLDLSQEQDAARALYGPRTGLVAVAPQHPPVTYIDGTRDELCEDLDVFADAATPGGSSPEAA